MIKGIVRQVDELGRIVLPKEIRRSLKIQPLEPLDIYLQNGVICIEKCRIQCVICGSAEEDNLSMVNDVHICKECASKAHTVWEGKK